MANLNDMAHMTTAELEALQDFIKAYHDCDYEDTCKGCKELFRIEKDWRTSNWGNPMTTGYAKA